MTTCHGGYVCCTTGQRRMRAETQVTVCDADALVSRRHRGATTLVRSYMRGRVQISHGSYARLGDLRQACPLWGGPAIRRGVRRIAPARSLISSRSILKCSSAAMYKLSRMHILIHDSPNERKGIVFVIMWATFYAGAATYNSVELARAHMLNQASGPSSGGYVETQHAHTVQTTVLSTL